ncbi:hypothetical protein L5515_018457 [Caenorhabditis briggsae]|uniref:Uncharacterized protein n=1 Tax=Caenorhabditis briggsae TaxID=6238 RepID=A0AAE9FM95_CAEBR|nr:hypothetical protein L5515_018457 [Caenorhabditis briggsae]
MERYLQNEAIRAQELNFWSEVDGVQLLVGSVIFFQIVGPSVLQRSHLPSLRVRFHYREDSDSPTGHGPARRMYPYITDE